MPEILLSPDEDMNEAVVALLKLAGPDGTVQLRTSHDRPAFEVDENTYDAWSKKHPTTSDDDDGKPTKTTPAKKSTPAKSTK